MFQFSRFAHYMHPFFKWIGFPIRKSADQFIFADPRGLSQLITSFIASESQGIPRVPFLTFFYHCRLLLGTVCFFDSCCVFLVFTYNSEPQQSSILLSSLSFFFFQYVKELLPRSSFADRLFHYPSLGRVMVGWWRITDSNR